MTNNSSEQLIRILTFHRDNITENGYATLKLNRQQLDLLIASLQNSSFSSVTLATIEKIKPEEFC